MQSLRKLSISFIRTLRNDIQRNLTSQPAANTTTGDKGM